LKADFISGNRGINWVFHFSNQILGQNLLDRGKIVSWSIIIVENPIDVPKFKHFSMHSFM
jgi:hypothetical protein